MIQFPVPAKWWAARIRYDPIGMDEGQYVISDNSVVVYFFYDEYWPAIKQLGGSMILTNYEQDEHGAFLGDTMRVSYTVPNVIFQDEAKAALFRLTHL